MLTQQILQQALIKKKLEEQKENYRKKQEGKPDKEDKENIRGGVRDGPTSSGSPLLAFTPTSVMRKNAAERKDSDPRPGVPELKITGQEPENGDRGGGAPPSPGRAILKGKGSERPGSLDLGGRSTRNTPGIGNPPPPPQHMMPGQGMPMGSGGHGLGGPAGMVGMPGNMQNPLMFLQNQISAQNQMGHNQNPQMGGPGGLPPGMLGQGGLGGFGHGMPPQHQPNNGNMGGLSGLFGGHFQHPGVMGGGGGGGIQGLRVGPPSPRGQTPLSPGSTLGRFFSNDVLAAAAAAGGSRQMKMPPLPTGQALTLEEIERQAATVKI